MAWDSRYRMLGEGEIIQEGDECLTDSHLGWEPAKHDIGGKAPDPNYTAHRIYRRLRENPMNDDLVSRLREEVFFSDEIMAARMPRDEETIDRYRSERKEAATALEEARAEIERRDAFIKELSDALLSIRPLGGSELFVKRFGNYYADPTYCKAAIEERIEACHNAIMARVSTQKRAEKAESELSTLRSRIREVVGPFVSHYSPWMDMHDPKTQSSTFPRHTFAQLNAARQLMEEVK